MNTKLQRKIENEFSNANEWIFKWKNNIEKPLVAEKEIRLIVDKIVNYQMIVEKNEKHLKDENEIRMNKLKCEFIGLSESIFNEAKSNYQFNKTYGQLISENNSKIFTLGIMGILHKEKTIESTYHNLFKKELPKHPKDEHPAARTLHRKFIIHTGPTNSGKTYESLEKLKEAKSGMYLAPLRLLALEVYEKMNISGVPCTLKTGEEEIDIPFSNHISSTIEMVDLDNYYDLVVIDEAQMVSDPARGNAWTRAILGLLSKEIHICCSVNAINLISKLINDCGDTIEIIKHERNTPLLTELKEFNFPKDLQSGDALIVFSRKKVLQIAATLSEIGIHSSIIYGNLPPETRRKQVQMFISGETDVVVSTDAIGMGLNLPIKRIIFLETEKFDGVEVRNLGDQEVKQIAGRAGRQGIYPKGYVNSINNKDTVFHQLKKKDDELIKAYVAPPAQTIFSIKVGTLKEKLQYWSSLKSNIKYIEKADVTEQMELLDLVNDDLYKKLTEEQLYKAIYIPFNTKNENLIELWNTYLKQTLDGVKGYKKPIVYLIAQLDELETMYREVDLYYSFSKTFNKQLDEAWVREWRETLSEQINEKLKNEMGNKQKLCKTCYTPLPWNSIIDRCEACYRKK